MRDVERTQPSITKRSPRRLIPMAHREEKRAKMLGLICAHVSTDFDAEKGGPDVAVAMIPFTAKRKYCYINYW
jgi:hypothetical protein